MYRTKDQTHKQTATLTPDDPDTISWVVPPACQGQIVECAYSRGMDEDGRLWERTLDRSDRSVSYRCWHVEDLDGCSWEPWNDVPGVVMD